MRNNKYRKKPAIVEAIQWTGSNRVEILKFVGDKGFIGLGPRTHEHSKLIDWLFIRTLEGRMRASIGDYIIKGVKGEVYPCRYDIFDLTYEVLDAD